MTMQVAVVDGPLGPTREFNPAGAGALLAFEGIVRPDEAGEQIAGLHYEAYEPMAIKEMHKLIDPISAGDYDVTFGSRALDRSMIGTHQPWRRLHTLGNCPVFSGFRSSRGGSR